MSPLLVPVWALGWWRLARDPALATWRAFAPASVLLVVVFMATGGKPYYVAGLYPVLLAAGGEPVAAWTRRSVGRARVFVAALALALINNALIVLPVLPVTAIAVSNALNPDLGETVGWPKFAETVAGVRAGLPDARVAVLAAQLRRGGRRRPLPACAAARAQRPQRLLGPRAAAGRRDRRHRRRVPGGAAAGLVRPGRAGRASSTTASGWTTTSRACPCGWPATPARPGRSSGRSCAAWARARTQRRAQTPFAASARATAVSLAFGSSAPDARARSRPSRTGRDGIAGGPEGHVGTRGERPLHGLGQRQLGGDGLHRAEVVGDGEAVELVGVAQELVGGRGQRAGQVGGEARYIEVADHHAGQRRVGQRPPGRSSPAYGVGRSP